MNINEMKVLKMEENKSGEHGVNYRYFTKGGRVFLQQGPNKRFKHLVHSFTQSNIHHLSNYGKGHLV
jgi:hypothetical protein